jgi:hypothetical protein
MGKRLDHLNGSSHRAVLLEDGSGRSQRGPRSVFCLRLDVPAMPPKGGERTSALMVAPPGGSLGWARLQHGPSVWADI